MACLAGKIDTFGCRLELSDGGFPHAEGNASKKNEFSLEMISPSGEEGVDAVKKDNKTIRSRRRRCEHKENMKKMITPS